MPYLSLALLGPFQATLDGAPVSAFEYNKVRALLAYLAVEADQPHRRESLVGLLWPDLTERAARQNLSQALANLRQAIGDRHAQPPFLLISRDAIQFNRASQHDLDVATFTAFLSICEAHHHRSWKTCTPCAKRLQQAVNLYRGDFLSQFFLSDSAPFEEWALLEREALRQRVIGALDHLVEYYEWRGAFESASHMARRQMELDPLREEFHRQAMRLLAASGQRSAALIQYEQCRRLLADELGVAPEAATTALYERLRDAERDAARSFAAFRPPPTNLPAPPTPLIGREQEVETVRNLVLQDEVRLMTLTGAPGIGKTRLGLHIASELRYDFEDGMFFVALAPVADPALVAATVARTFGLMEIGAQPISTVLTTYLRDKHLLLLLDNFEQVLEAAALVADLLAACPQIKVLVTSRAALRVRAERQFPVPPLPLPDRSGPVDVERAAHAPAVMLFVERAQTVAPGFALTHENVNAVVEICARLDGLPLAIELVAARSNEWAPSELLAQLHYRLPLLTEGPRDLPARQQTLRNAIGWSYSLLKADEQSLLARLGVFAGGWALEAAEFVCGSRREQESIAPSPVTQTATRDLLSRLVDRSLVMVEQHGKDERYRMLETIREYAREKLSESRESERVQNRHLDFFLKLAEEADPKLRGPDEIVWYERLEREHDNQRTALNWALENQNAELGLRLAGKLARFWFVRGHLREGTDWLEKALAQAQGASALSKAEALKMLGTFLGARGDSDRGARVLEESLALYRGLGDRAGMAWVLNYLGMNTSAQGDHAKAKRLLAESLAMRRELGDPWSIAHTLQTFVSIAWQEGDYSSVKSFAEEALALFQQAGDKRGIARQLLDLGILAQREGDTARAITLLVQALSQLWQVGDRWLSAHVLESLAPLAEAQGAPERAARLFGAAEALRETIGMSLLADGRAHLERYERDVDALRKRLDEKTLAKAWAEGSTMTLEEAVAEVLGQGVGK